MVPPRCTQSRLRHQEIRALLVARKQLVLGSFSIDVELSIRGILRGFGLKVGPVTRKHFEAQIRESFPGQAKLSRYCRGNAVRRGAALKVEYAKLHKAVLTSTAVTIRSAAG